MTPTRLHVLSHGVAQHPGAPARSTVASRRGRRRPGCCRRGCGASPLHHRSGPRVGPGVAIRSVRSRAVQQYMGVAGGLGGQQRPVQRRLPGGEHGDGLVAVVVGGRDPMRCPGPAGSCGCRRTTSATPARPACRCSTPGCPSGTPADPLGVQQAGQEQHAVLGHVQDGGVCDTHGGAEPCTG